MTFDEWIALNFPANRGELALARKAWQVAEAMTIERCAKVCEGYVGLGGVIANDLRKLKEQK